MGGVTLSFYLASLPWIILAITGAYLIGSIPFGFVLTRLAGLGDIRKVGSGNIGATNVLRTGHKGLALATLLLDGGKGTLAVLLAYYFGGDRLSAFAALGVVVGHIFPIWLGFRGGKGVATAIGAFLGLNPYVGLIVCGIWLLIALVFRYSSVAALVAHALAPICLYFMGAGRLYIGIGLAIALLVWIRHSSNIQRLLNGQEPRIGQAKESHQ